MAFQVPTTEPEVIFANTTVQWTKELTDFPASTWTLTYFFAHSTAANDFNIVATASGSTHVVSVAASVSNAYAAGTYRWYARVVSGSEVHMVEDLTGEVEVKADPVDAGARVKSHNQTMLDAIRSVLEGTAGTDVQSYTIGGRSLSRYSLEELMKFEAKYTALVANEKRKENAAKGILSSNLIREQFKKG